MLAKARERTGRYMLKIETLHHVSLQFGSKTARNFRSILDSKDTDPPFDFEGAWYQLGNRQLHLIVYDGSTFRAGKEVDSHDIHFAIRVNSYRDTRDFLRSKGYHPDAVDEFKKMRENPKATAGFPQLYIMDPDRNSSS